MTTLQQATSLSANGDRVIAQIDPAWDIWGPCGGYLASIAMRAAGAAIVGHRPVTLSCQFLSRARHGEAVVDVEVAKSGQSACLNVTLSQDGRRFLQTQIWTTANSDGPTTDDAAMPDVPPPEALEPIEAHLERHGQPAIPFLRNFAVRPVDFRAVGNPDPRGARIERWQRYRGWEATEDPFLDAARAVIAIDTHVWMAHVRGLKRPPTYVAPSLDLTVWFHQPAGASDWLLVDARSDVAQTGLIHGLVRVWSEQGRLVATGGSQCLVFNLPPRANDGTQSAAAIPKLK